MKQQQRTLQQSAVVDASPAPASRYPTRVAQAESQYIRSAKDLVLSAGVFLVGLVLLFGVTTAVIGAWREYIETMSWLFKGIILIGSYAVPAICIYVGIRSIVRDLHQARRATEDLRTLEDQRKRENHLADAEVEKLQAEAERIRAEAAKIRRTIDFDEIGNAAILDEIGRVVQIRGNYQEHPRLSSLHYNQKMDGLQAGNQAMIAAPGDVSAPTIEEIVNKIARNSFELILGRSKLNREFITIELPDAHIKLIGGSRMGKSCEAAAILEQARQTHDPDHLRIALLDLEYKTSKLFEGDPHILVLKTEYKRIHMHMKDVEQVADGLIHLHDLMNYRYTLTDAQVDQEPHVLVYLEEFLYWKKLLGNFVSSEKRQQALDAFTGLATRGLKVGIHLMACAQVDYADEELRDAMAQFLAVNVAFSVKPTAAQAAGFVNSELLKKNYESRTPGEFVVEAIGGSDLGVAPNFDVRAKLRAMATPTAPEKGGQPESQPKASRKPDETQDRNEGEDPIQAALQAKVSQVMENPGEGMVDCLKRVWNARPGDTESYRKAKQEYIQVQEIIHAMARKAMQSYQQAEYEGREV